MRLAEHGSHKFIDLTDLLTDNLSCFLPDLGKAAFHIWPPSLHQRFGCLCEFSNRQVRGIFFVELSNRTDFKRTAMDVALTVVDTLCLIGLDSFVHHGAV